MKRFTLDTQIQTLLALGAFLLAMPFAGNSQSSTEIDDLYFSKSDRAQIKYATDGEGKKVTQSEATYQAYTNDTYDPSYSAKKVNPEYIAKYKSASRESVQEQLNEQSALDAEENQNYSDQDYFVEGYETQGYSSGGSTVVNVYNGNGWNSWAPYNNFAFSSWNSPFWNPGWGFSIGYSWGWGGFGWNSGFGSPWGFYDPWYGSAWGFYDPWYGPSWGFGRWNRWSRWNNPYYAGWGYNNWAYNSGYYDGYYVGKAVGLNAKNIVRGGRVNRSAAGGGTYASNGVSTRYRNANATNVTGSRSSATASTRGRTVSATTNSRDFSGTQNEYFQRSRMGYTSGVGTSDRNTRAVTSRTSAREEYQNATRSREAYTPAERSNSRTTNPAVQSRTRESNPAATQRSSSGSSFRGVNPDNSRNLNTTQPARQASPEINRSRGNNGYSAPARETYSPPSRSRSNGTYSTPSYRNGGSSGNSRSNYSAPSRSSSPSYSAPSRSSSPSFSAPSRSSSPSYSAPSRSSGSSGGSRSSGGSSGSRRGGN